MSLSPINYVTASPKRDRIYLLKFHSYSYNIRWRRPNEYSLGPRGCRDATIAIVEI